MTVILAVHAGQAAMCKGNIPLVSSDKDPRRPLLLCRQSTGPCFLQSAGGMSRSDVLTPACESFSTCQAVGMGTD